MPVPKPQPVAYKPDLDKIQTKQYIASMRNIENRQQDRSHLNEHAEKLDAMLDDFELIHLQAQGGLGIVAENEKWHQEEPALSSRWQDNNGINRSVTSSITVDQNLHRKGYEVGVSAWMDDEKTLTRSWKHIPIVQYGRYNKDQHQMAVNIAFATVQLVTPEDLTETAPIQAIPTASE